MTAQAESNIARDPQIAVQEEYQIAIERGTAEALGLFLERHPDSPLAGPARKRQLELIERDRRRFEPVLK